jgi:glycolate oxidase FAD binding subunit
MSLRPTSISGLQDALAQASAQREPARRIDLSLLNRLLEHRPEDLTCTVECGCTLGSLQQALGAKGQWLPLDPPEADRLNLAELIQTNRTGPCRLGFGTVRDYLIGLHAILADGTRIHSGGQVVKNVAGYDLHKLWIGSHGAFGVPVMATFKLLPLPEASVCLQTQCSSVETGLQQVNSVRERIPGAVGLDLVRMNPAEANQGAVNGGDAEDTRGVPCTVVVQLAGTSADVARQQSRAEALGLRATEAPLEEAGLWRDPDAPPARVSVLPSRLGEVLALLHGQRFVARAGNGIVYHTGPPILPRPRPPRFLIDRLKRAFDPLGILPPVPEFT